MKECVEDDCMLDVGVSYSKEQRMLEIKALRRSSRKGKESIGGYKLKKVYLMGINEIPTENLMGYSVEEKFEGVDYVINFSNCKAKPKSKCLEIDF